MKQKLKALASLCLALALTLCLTLPAWAAGGDAAGRSITQETKGSISLSWGTTGDTDTVTSVTAYKVIRVDYQYPTGDDNYEAPKDPEFFWVNEVADWVRKNYSDYIGTGTDNSVQDTFNKNASADDIAAFYDSLAAAIRGGTAIQNFQPTKTETVEKNQTECTISDLQMGNYLVLIEGGMKIYRPSAVNLVPVWQEGESDQGEWVISSPAEVTIKSSEPTITKKVKDTATYSATDNVPELEYAQVAIGDTVTYILEADVPQFPADAINKGYVISDDLPDGMTLGNVTVYGVKPVSGGNATEDPLTQKQEGTNTSPDLTYTLTTPTADGTTVSRPDGVTGEKNVNFKVEFSNIVDIYKAGYTKVKVTYTATANEKIQVVSNSNATHVNQNTAYLDYNNNPYKKADDTTPLSWQTDSDTADVYTYGIQVQKKGETQEGTTVDNLPGAVFELTAAGDDSNYNSTATPIEFVPTTPNADDGEYRKAVTDNDANVTTELDVGNAVASNPGQLQLSGLDVGIYYLKEIKAPDGYNLLAQPVKITITDDGTTTPADGIVDDKNATTGYVSGTTITNTQGFTLPTTGGMGTVLFTAGGVVLMGAGLVLLVVFLRRRRAK